jgi:phosphomannomutase
MTRHIFREYDIRGVAERDLTSDVVERIGRGIAELIGKSVDKPPRIAVGRDCRLSGPRIYAALTQGLQRGGAQLLDVGIGPTPALYFGVHHLEADGGVMITGSHNAAPDNGFKIMIGHGSFFGSAIQELRGLVEGLALPDKPGGSLTPDRRCLCSYAEPKHRVGPQTQDRRGRRQRRGRPARFEDAGRPRHHANRAVLRHGRSLSESSS